MTELTIESKVKWIGKTVALFFTIGILGSINLWISDRHFPLAPVLSGLPTVPPALGWFLFTAVVSSLLGVLLRFDKRVLLLFLVVLSVLIFMDQNRIQPWVYFYSLILIFYFEKKNKEDGDGTIPAVQILLICMYLWSGVHKLNDNYLNSDFTRSILVLIDLENIFTPDLQKIVAYLIPISEILVGVLLIFKTSRQVGFLLSIVIHISIIILLSPIGLSYDSIVIPWNLAILILNYLVFYKNQNSILVNGWKPYLVLGLAGLMPALNLFHATDDFVSFSWYSKKNKRFYIAVSEKYWPVLKLKSEVLLQIPENTAGGYIIDVNKWSYSELHVPAYPEFRVFKRMSQSFCSRNIPSTDLIFLMYQQPMKNENLTKWTCED